MTDEYRRQKTMELKAFVDEYRRQKTLELYCYLKTLEFREYMRELRDQKSGKTQPRNDQGEYVPMNGGDLTDSEKSATINNNDERDVSYISARGPNEFKFGFSYANLLAHWFGEYDKSGNVVINSHREEYEDRHMDMKAYAERALNLIQSPCSKNIDGYKTADGTLVRFDKTTGDFVKGHPDRGIKTMFVASQNYFDRRKAIETSVTDTEDKHGQN